MLVIYSEEHRFRDAKTELSGGQLVPPFECPKRADYILARCRERKIGEIISPQDFGRESLLAVHDEDYLRFLENCWDEWKKAGYEGEAIATTWPSRAMTRTIPPNEIDGLIGYYCLAAETAISDGTWRAGNSGGKCRTKRTTPTGKRQKCRLCPVSPARTPRGKGYVWRLLFFE